MPYIGEERRNVFDPFINSMWPVKTKGELNYVFTMIGQKYIADHGGVSYDNVADAIGSMFMAGLEMYRRLVGPYEDIKCRLNGDCYYLLESEVFGGKNEEANNTKATGSGTPRY